MVLGKDEAILAGRKEVPMKSALFAVGLSFLALSASAARTDAEKKGLEIMLKYYHQMTTKNFRSDVVMQLIDASGRVQTRHLKRLSKTDADDCEKYLLIFYAPPTLKGTALLIVEQKDRDDDVWFYMPAIRKMKRISGSNMRSSYVGTEFTYRDIKREKIDPTQNRYVFVKEEMLRGVKHYVVDVFPISKKAKDEWGYHHRRLWIRSDNYLVTRSDFYDESGRFLKRLLCYDMRKVGDSGKERYFRYEMTNRKGVKTIIKFNLMRINGKDPDDRFFTKAFLLRSR